MLWQGYTLGVLHYLCNAALLYKVTHKNLLINQSLLQYKMLLLTVSLPFIQWYNILLSLPRSWMLNTLYTRHSFDDSQSCRYRWQYSCQTNIGLLYWISLCPLDRWVMNMYLVFDCNTKDTLNSHITTGLQSWMLDLPPTHFCIPEGVPVAEHKEGIVLGLLYSSDGLALNYSIHDTTL